MNIIVIEMEEIAKQMDDNQQIKESNLTEFTECLFNVSRLRNDDRSYGIEAFVKMIAKGFEIPNSKNISKTAVYKLFKCMCEKVLKEQYHFEITEELYLELLVGVGSRIAFGHGGCSDEEKYYMDYYRREYTGVFKEECDLTYEEIIRV